MSSVKVKERGELRIEEESPYEHIVNVLGFAINGFGLFYGIMFISEDGEGIFYYRGWPGKFKYLTFWNQIIQTVYFAISLLKNIYINKGSEKSGTALQKKLDKEGLVLAKTIKRDKLHRFRDRIHTSIVFPIGGFVVVTFWMLYAINRDLVFPKNMDKVVPAWQNHISHTYPLLILLLEKYYVRITYTKRRKGLSITIAFAMIYQAWILWIAYYTDIWVYPVLRILNWFNRCLFFGALYVMLCVLYISGEWFSRICWTDYFSR